MRMLKPMLATLNTSRVKTLTARIGATERTRGSKWVKIRAKWLSAHPVCVMCEAKGYARPATQLDHIIPLWQGGKDDESNYQSLCVPCHDEKTAEEAKQRAGGGSRV